MRMFGRSSGGGRRSAKRVPAPVAATIKTLSSCRYATVEDLSCTGVRLRGPDLPRAGEEVELRLDPLSAFGSVAWSARERCGITFDIPLTEFDVVLVKRRAGLQPAAGLSPDEQIALEQWATGVSR